MDEFAQIKLRLPARLKRLVELAATSEGRSVTAEITLRLEHSFADQTDPLQRVQDEIKALRKEIAASRPKLATPRKRRT